jgi:hypothetical protein
LALAAVVAASLASALAAAALGAGQKPGGKVGEEPAYELMGSDCEAEGSSFEDTVIQHDIFNSGFNIRAPFDGVVTEWTVQLGYEPPKPIPLTLSVANQVGESNNFEIKSQTAAAQVKKGANVFQSRLPIFKGELIALSSVGEGPMPYCQTDHPAYNNVWSAGKSSKLGETVKFVLLTGYAPVKAKVEEDRDHDGFGDVTQDRCPRNAKRHKRPCRKPAPADRPGGHRG